MKPVFFLGLAFVLFTCKPDGNSSAYGVERNISIVEGEGYFKSLIKFKTESDVIICRVNPCSETHFQYGYAIVIYKKEKKGLKRRFDFVSISNDVYDKALYNWENDTVVKIKLYNSTSKLSEGLKQTLRSNGATLSREPYD